MVSTHSDTLTAVNSVDKFTKRPEFGILNTAIDHLEMQGIGKAAPILISNETYIYEWHIGTILCGDELEQVLVRSAG